MGMDVKSQAAVGEVSVANVGALDTDEFLWGASPLRSLTLRKVDHCLLDAPQTEWSAAGRDVKNCYRACKTFTRGISGGIMITVLGRDGQWEARARISASAGARERIRLLRRKIEPRQFSLPSWLLPVRVRSPAFVFAPEPAGRSSAVPTPAPISCYRSAGPWRALYRS